MCPEAVSLFAKELRHAASGMQRTDAACKERMLKDALRARIGSYAREHVCRGEKKLGIANGKWQIASQKRK